MWRPQCLCASTSHPPAARHSYISQLLPARLIWFEMPLLTLNSLSKAHTFYLFLKSLGFGPLILSCWCMFQNTYKIKNVDCMGDYGHTASSTRGPPSPSWQILRRRPDLDKVSWSAAAPPKWRRLKYLCNYSLAAFHTDVEFHQNILIFSSIRPHHYTFASEHETPKASRRPNDHYGLTPELMLICCSLVISDIFVSHTSLSPDLNTDSDVWFSSWLMAGLSAASRLKHRGLKRGIIYPRDVCKLAGEQEGLFSQIPFPQVLRWRTSEDDSLPHFSLWRQYIKILCATTGIRLHAHSLCPFSIGCLVQKLF